MLQLCLMRGRTTSLCLLRISFLLAFLALTRPAARGEPNSANPPRRLARTNLLIYRSDQGEILPAKSVRDWQKRRYEVVRGMQQIMGPLPGKEKRCPLDLKVEEEVD